MVLGTLQASLVCLCGQRLRAFEFGEIRREPGVDTREGVGQDNAARLQVGFAATATVLPPLSLPKKIQLRSTAQYRG